MPVAGIVQSEAPVPAAEIVLSEAEIGPTGVSAQGAAAEIVLSGDKIRTYNPSIL